MIHPPLKTEENRLAALYRYSILDTAPEARFEEIAQIASVSCDVPIVLISFVDRDRQWFKSKIGLLEQQSSRLHSFCHYAIEAGQTLIVPDTFEDSRFTHHPLVSGSRPIRFYAGALLTTSDGFHLGTLCLMDYRPRQLLNSQKRLLEHLAHSIMLELELEFSQKQMAGIAHEINNPLAVIHARMEHLKRLVNQGKATSEILIQNAGKVERIVDRIRSIVQGLQAFSQNKRKSPAQGIPLASVIQDALFFFEERLKRSSVEFSIEGLDQFGNERLHGRPVQISQAILNLLVNACDAIEETSSVPRRIHVRFQDMRQRIQIRICDSAPAISEALTQRIFEPYFTTKPDGKGTGLGLSVSRSLVESFGGKLYLDQTTTEKAFVIDLVKAGENGRADWN